MSLFKDIRKTSYTLAIIVGDRLHAVTVIMLEDILCISLRNCTDLDEI